MRSAEGHSRTRTQGLDTGDELPPQSLSNRLGRGAGSKLLRKWVSLEIT